MRRERQRRTRRSYTPSHVLYLRSGIRWFHDEDDSDVWPHWSDIERMPAAKRAALTADIRQAWQHLREVVIEDEHKWFKHSWSMPWAWWQFDAAKPYDSTSGKPEWLQLFELGIITHETATEAAKDEAGKYIPGNYHCGGKLFRRPHGWWFLSVIHRDEQQSEAAQLIEMGALAECEQDVLAKGTSHIKPEWHWRAMFGHLTAEERDLLNITCTCTARS